jgi:hypothetical protein
VLGVATEYEAATPTTLQLLCVHRLVIEDQFVEIITVSRFVRRALSLGFAILLCNRRDHRR